MKVGILGGTGEMGRGLTVRLALKHDILIGSRSREKAVSTAFNLENFAKGFYQSTMVGSVKGMLNEEAINLAEVVIVALPPEASIPYIKEKASLFTSEKIVISTVVPMKRKNKLFYWTPLGGLDIGEQGALSAAEAIQGLIRPAKVITAFQTVPAAYLHNIDAVLNIDVLMAGDDNLSLAKVGQLVRDIPNLRALRVGPLENSKFIESITPLLLNAAILNDLRDPSIRIVPWMPAPE